MKNLIYILAVFFTLSFSTKVQAAEKEQPTVALSAAERAELELLKNRVEEIRMMDKSHLTRTEKKALRKELKELKKRSDFLGEKVTLSIGAIIIILLLLILIL